MAREDSPLTCGLVEDWWMDEDSRETLNEERREACSIEKGEKKVDIVYLKIGYDPPRFRSRADRRRIGSRSERWNLCV